MRGDQNLQNPMFFVANTEERLSPDHPLRAIKRRADEVLKQMSTTFDAAYSAQGRPSIPPEALLKALLLQALYSISSERRLVEAINWNLLYRWFCDLDPDQAVWDATTFTKNRERFERHGLVGKFFERVVQTALVEEYASNDHFTVDGTLIQSWASLKSFRPKDERRDEPPTDGGRNPSVDFRGQKRSNDTHQSTTDPEARLRRFRRRHHLRPKTLSGDKGYEAGGFLRTIEKDLKVTPHVPISAARATTPGPEGDARRRMLRRMKTLGDQISQRARKKVEQIFGWLKQPGGLRKVRHVGRWKIQQVAYLWAAAYNLLRLAHLDHCAA